MFFHDNSIRKIVVFTNVNFNNFDKNIATQLWFNVTVDGDEFTVCDEYRVRTVLQVVNGVADYEGADYEDAKAYAIRLREEYEAYLASKEEN